jgi:hypothetical protein
MLLTISLHMILDPKIFAGAVTFQAEKANILKEPQCKEVAFNIWTAGKYAGYCALAQTKTSLTLGSLFLNGRTPLNSLDDPRPKHENGFLNKGLGTAIVESLYNYCQRTSRRTLNITYTHSVNLLTMVQHRYTDVVYELNGSKFAGSLAWLYLLDKYLFVLPDESIISYYHHQDGRFLPEDKPYFGYRPKIENGQFFLKDLRKNLIIGRAQGLSVRILPTTNIYIPVRPKD